MMLGQCFLQFNNWNTKSEGVIQAKDNRYENAQQNSCQLIVILSVNDNVNNKNYYNIYIGNLIVMS